MSDEENKITISKNEDNLTEAELSRLTSQIVSAYVAHNHIQPSDLVSLLKDIRNNLKGSEAPVSVSPPPPVMEEEKEEAPQKPLIPAVPVNKSIHHDYLVCLEDGKQMTMLKRYLMTNYGLTPEAYREKWNLPRDYPMSAPGYSEARSKLARDLGLGRKPKAKEPKTAEEPAIAPEPKIRGRKKTVAE